jgi:hypothetical protein
MRSAIHHNSGRLFAHIISIKHWLIKIRLLYSFFFVYFCRSWDENWIRVWRNIAKTTFDVYFYGDKKKRKSSLVLQMKWWELFVSSSTFRFSCRFKKFAFRVLFVKCLRKKHTIYFSWEWYSFHVHDIPLRRRSERKGEK